MGLLPLEFRDCLTDSPYFRENIHAHEKELEKTSQQIKTLIKECKDLLAAAKNLSKAQRSFSTSLVQFKFECIGNTQTDDEIVIAGSLKEFGRLISAIEDERDRMLERAYDQFIMPLENFRKDQIGGAKEQKKKFEKQTLKFCQSLERHLNLSTKKNEGQLQESDASLEMEKRHFYQASLEYVFRLQEVQERKKFEFVETLLGFMYGWLTFYHQGHEVAKDYRPYMTDLQVRLQKCRESFNSTRDETEMFMNKMLEKSMDSGSINKMYTRQGYLFLMEKTAFGTKWTKHYCMYQKDTKVFTLIPYHQVQAKFSGSDMFKVESCVRRMTESIDKRFCFDITADDRPGTLTLQALSEDDRRQWIDAMDGVEPIYHAAGVGLPKIEGTSLDETGFLFVKKCIGAIEKKGLDDQGLYRIAGVSSKSNKLLQIGLDRRKSEKLDLDDAEWETKTITSALKQYLRNLPEPLMMFQYHNAFVAAAKQESQHRRVNDIHALLYKLPELNRKMLELLIRHLTKVAERSHSNLMTVANLGVCFGPTLMRPEEETVAAIMDIKFCNVVVEILIRHCDRFFQGPPDGSDVMLRRQLSAEEKNQDNVSMTSRSTGSPRGSLPNSSPTHAGFPNVSPNHSSRSNVNSLHRPRSGEKATKSVAATYVPAPAKATHYTPVQDDSSTSAPVTPLAPNRSISREHDGAMSTSVPSAVILALSRSQATGKARPTPIYSNAAGDIPLPNTYTTGSSSSSSESLLSSYNSLMSNHTHSSSSSPQLNQKQLLKYGPTYPTYQRPEQMSTTSLSNLSAGQTATSRRVRTLYICQAENESELSFEPNQIITNVRPSREPGWLQGTLNGKTGLIPENYVEYLP